MYDVPIPDIFKKKLRLYKILSEKGIFLHSLLNTFNVIYK